MLRNKQRIVRAKESPTLLVATDASAWGWGYFAYNTTTGEVRAHGERWSRVQIANLGDKLAKSTFSEPQGVLNALCHLLKAGGPTRVRIFTDNTVTQASYTRGFNSHSWHINDCLRRARDLFGDAFDVDFTYIPGGENPADAFSRGIPVTEVQRGYFAGSLRRFAGLGD